MATRALSITDGWQTAVRGNMGQRYMFHPKKCIAQLDKMRIILNYKSKITTKRAEHRLGIPGRGIVANALNMLEME